MGIVFQVHMEDLKRMLHLVPPVSVVTYYEDEVQPRKQILDQLGFALRLTGNAAGNHLLVNGKKYYAAYPHILLKKPGEIHEDSGGAVHSSFFFAYSPAISDNVMNMGTFDEFIFSELPQHWETFGPFKRKFFILRSSAPSIGSICSAGGSFRSFFWHTSRRRIPSRTDSGRFSKSYPIFN